MLSVIFWSLWRRLYGEGKFKEYFSRTIQTLIGTLVLAYQLHESWTWQQVILVLLVSLWIILQYWSRSVGEIIDAGLNPCQGRKNYDRWFKAICNWIVKFLNWILPDKYHIHKYYGVYDWIYSGMRNLVGVIPGMVYHYSWLWWVLVLCMYPIYRFCYWLFETYPWMYNNETLKKLTLNEPKNLAEILHGALFGVVICLI